MCYGLTKREYFAGLAMQGLVYPISEMDIAEGAEHLAYDSPGKTIELAAKLSVKYADALLTALEGE